MKKHERGALKSNLSKQFKVLEIAKDKSLKKLLNLFLIGLLTFTNVMPISAEDTNPVNDGETTVEVSNQEDSEEEKSLANYSVHELLHTDYETIMRAVELGNINAINIVHNRELAEEEYKLFLELKANYDAKLIVSEVPNEELSSSEEIENTSANQERETTLADTSSLDFSTKRLIVASEEELKDDHIISSYEGLYLLQFETEEEARQAYLSYLDKAEFVEPDIEVIATEDSDTQDDNATEMSEEENPLSELGKELEKEETFAETQDKKQIVVALLDSGTGEGANVIGRVSMLGDKVDDDNGHGSNMLDTMINVNPDIKVLSVKVLDENGKGNISSVVAGIEYAIEQGVDIINLSLSAKATAENSILADYVKKAVEKGIKVIVSAGNDNRNVKWYIPANIEEAIVVGSANHDGTKTSTSNFGETVDYYVVADSTSVATAKLSAWYSLHFNETPNELILNLNGDTSNEEASGDGEFEASDMRHVDPDWFANNDELILINPKPFNQISEGPLKTTDDSKIYHNIGTYGGRTVGVKVSAHVVNGSKYRFGNNWDDGFRVYNGWVDWTFEFFYEDSPNTYINMEHAFFAVGSLGDAYNQHEREFVGKDGLNYAYVSSDPATAVVEKPIGNSVVWGGADPNSFVDDYNNDSFAKSTVWLPLSGTSNKINTYTKANDWHDGDEYGFWWAPMTYKFKAVQVIINYLEEGTNNVLATRYKKGYWAGTDFNVPNSTANWNVDINKYVYVRNTTAGGADNLNINNTGVSATTNKQDLTVNLYYKLNNRSLTIKYLNKLNDQPVATQYGPADTPIGSQYAINSPNVDGFYLVDNAQSTVSGTMPAEDTTIIVYYLPYHKITTEVVNGDIDPNIENIPYGENRSVNYSPNEGYILSTIEVDGVKQDLDGIEKKYDFNNITDDHHIKVVYEKQDPPVKTVEDAEGNDINQLMVDEGEKLYYEITWQNPTAVEQTYTITDIVPENAKFISADNGGVETNGTIKWENIKLAGKTSKTVGFVVETVGLGKYIPNTAKLTITPPNQPKIELDSNTVENWTPEPPKKDIANEQLVSINGEYQLADTVVVFPISVHNVANIAKVYNLTDELDERLEILEVSDGGTLEGHVATWKLTLQANQEKTVYVKARITEEAKDSIVANDVMQIVDKAKHTVEDIPEVPVLLEPTKRVLDENFEDINKMNVSKGAKLFYELQVHNCYTEEKEFTFVDELVDTGVKLIRVNNGGKEEDGVITWTKVLQPDETWTVSYEVETTMFGVYIPNEADLYVDKITAKTNLVENWVPKEPVKKVINEKDEDANYEWIVAQDERQLKYTISFENPSDHPVDVVITDTLEKPILYVEASHNGVYDEETRTITWTLKDVPARTFDFEVSVDIRFLGEYAQTKINNEANVEFDKFNHKTNIVTNYLVDDPTTIDVEGKKTWDDNNNEQGLRPKYIVVELLANGETYRTQKVVGDGNEWSYTFSYLPKYMKGAEVVYTVDEYPVDNYASFKDGMNLTNKVIPAPIKSVVKDGKDINLKEVGVGEEFDYEIKVKNIFDETKDVAITDTIPNGLEILSISDNGVKLPDNTVSWLVPVKANAEKVVKVHVKVLGKAEGVLTNQAQVIIDGNKQDTNKVYNPVVKLIEPIKSVHNSKGDDINGKALNEGEVIEYRIAVENPFAEEKEMTLSDVLPKGLEFVSADNNGKFNDGAVEWTFKLKAKGKITVSFKVKVAKSEQGLFENTAKLKVGDEVVFSNTVRNTKCCTIPCKPFKPVDTAIKK